nr:hypothetical protein [Eubacterium sp.]
MRNTGGNIGKIITIALMAGCIFLTSCTPPQDVKQEFIPDTVSESAIREETDNEKAAETSVKYKYRNSTNL